MASQRGFSPAEWRTLQFAPLWVFHLVAGADLFIDEDEKLALLRRLSDCNAYDHELCRTVICSVQQELPALLLALKEDGRDALTGLRQVAALLASKAGEPAAGHFKESLVDLGRTIAGASGERLFGAGDRVSPDEQKALLLIARSLESPAAQNAG